MRWWIGLGLVALVGTAHAGEEDPAAEATQAAPEADEGAADEAVNPADDDEADAEGAPGEAADEAAPGEAADDDAPDEATTDEPAEASPDEPASDPEAPAEPAGEEVASGPRVEITHVADDEDELPVVGPSIETLWDELGSMPPRQSWDLAVATGFGDIGYWRTFQAPFLHMGVRGSWGTHRGDARLGGGLLLAAEGPVPEFFTLALEPHVAWDRIQGRTQIGASLGLAGLWHSRLTLWGLDSYYGVTPSLALRLGWSQPWSRLTRRAFVTLEPKLRWINGPSPSISVVVGQGYGR